MALREILEFVPAAQQKAAEEFIIRFGLVHKNMMLSRYNALNGLVKPQQVVLLGDSITEEFPAHEMLPDIGLYNRGISGNDTYDILNRLEQHIYPLQPGKLFLLIGVNDLAKYPNDTPQMVSLRIEEILDKLAANLPKCKLHLISVYPVNKSSDAKIDQVMLSFSDNQRIVALNGYLRQLAQQKNLPYLDIHPQLLNAEGELDLVYTREGLHLTVEGYQVVVQALRPYLSSVE